MEYWMEWNSKNGFKREEGGEGVGSPLMRHLPPSLPLFLPSPILLLHCIFAWNDMLLQDLLENSFLIYMAFVPCYTSLNSLLLLLGNRGNCGNVLMVANCFKFLIVISCCGLFSSVYCMTHSPHPFTLLERYLNADFWGRLVLGCRQYCQ